MATSKLIVIDKETREVLMLLRYPTRETVEKAMVDLLDVLKPNKIYELQCIREDETKGSSSLTMCPTCCLPMVLPHLVHCKHCQRHGLPSAMEPGLCTNCANVKRGV